jgi:glycosyltransferase involved in cell wall biosynthesis/GT2 family glycosyltransferase
MSVLIVDPIAGVFDPAREPFEVLTPKDLAIEDFDALSVRYGITELCCALKPRILQHLLEEDDTVVYLDSDMLLFAPLEGLAERLEAHPFLLTPHLLEPLPDDGLQPSELAILLAGSSNLGFAAARSNARVDALLGWWSERLRTGSRLDPAAGMVFDQRWADLMPGMFDGVGLWREPGVNFGYWRAASHRLERGPDGPLIDGLPLRCFHFTGLDPHQPERLSKYDSRTLLEHQPVLEEVCQEFRERLDAHGWAETSEWPYGFATTASGASLTAEDRALWDRGARDGGVLGTPFTAEGERSFLRWAAEPEPLESGEPLSRYLKALHDARADLRQRFPDPRGAHRSEYLAWVAEQAVREPRSLVALIGAQELKPGNSGLRQIHPGDAVGATRGETVVCIPVYGGLQLLAECLRSVLRHTPSDVPVLIADDASPDPAIEGFTRELADAGAFARRDVIYMRQPANLGFPGNVNSAFAAAAPADVVVLNSDCVVAEGWLQGLRRAAYSDSLVATASTLTNHGTILSVPERNRPLPGLPQDQDLESAAASVLRESQRLYPRLPTAIGHCMYIRRHALELVGDFDTAFSPGYGEEVDFSQRCALQGLVHVAADDVFVLHRSGGSLGADGAVNRAQAAHEAIIHARYPYYDRAQTAAAHSEVGPLPRSLATARRAIRGMSATIDARCLGPVMTGTQLHTLEVIRALSNTGRLRLRVIVPPDLGEHAEHQLAGLERVEVIPHTDVHPAMSKSDVAHRPYQLSSPNDLLVLHSAAERVVVTHQDLIAYRNPGYFPGYPQWQRYQRVTRQALALADRIVFFSRHAAADAVREELVDGERISVIYIGVDHAAERVIAPHAPRGVERLADRPMLLCLGTDFRHKNRVFALRVLDALRAEHAWEGMLVLAGPRVADGSSSGEEAAYLAGRGELADQVIVLPAVSEAEKAWLLERCAAVLYPTTYEGFGLMPFEAAAHDRPCLFASQSALAETLPAELATLVPWDPQASAERIHHLLSTPGSGDAQAREIRRAGARFTWNAAAEALVDVYLAAASLPARDAARLATETASIEAGRDEAERKYNELWSALTPDARALLAPDGLLSRNATHSLAEVAHRPILRRLLLGPAQLAYRVAGLGRRRDPIEPPATSAEAFALHFAGDNRAHMAEQLAVADEDSLLVEP